jgi:hypothetical protein
MPDMDLMDAIFNKAGLTAQQVSTHVELIVRTAAGGVVWETGAERDKKHAVFMQFEAGALPGDVEVFLVPVVNNQPYRRTTVNRQYATYVDAAMSQLRFVTAVAERLTELALEQGFAYCTGESCVALTYAEEEKCRVCGASLDLLPDDDEEEEPEGEKAEPEASPAPPASPTAASVSPPPATKPDVINSPHG